MKRVLMTVLFLAGTVWLLAQEEQPKLSLVIRVEKEMKVQEEGKLVTRYLPVDKAAGGDILLYTIVYTNQGRSQAKNATIVDAIPEGTVYVLESAGGKEAEVLFSIDGGKLFQKYPAKYLVTKKDGTREEKEATPEMYTHVQWLLKKPVAPGQSGSVTFKVKVK